LRTLTGDLTRLNDAVESLRKAPPASLSGRPVAAADLESDNPGAVDLAGGHGERSPGHPLPPADVLIWHLGPDARVMIRPSGTEPEIKVYAEVVRPVRSRSELAAARADATAQVDELMAAAAAALEPGDKS
jgi:phosphomannomutase